MSICPYVAETAITFYIWVVFLCLSNLKFEIVYIVLVVVTLAWNNLIFLFIVTAGVFTNMNDKKKKRNEKEENQWKFNWYDNCAVYL